MWNCYLAGKCPKPTPGPILALFQRGSTNAPGGSNPPTPRQFLPWCLRSDHSRDEISPHLVIKITFRDSSIVHIQHNIQCISIQLYRSYSCPFTTKSSNLRPEFIVVPRHVNASAEWLTTIWIWALVNVITYKHCCIESLSIDRCLKRFHLLRSFKSI